MGVGDGVGVGVGDGVGVGTGGGAGGGVGEGDGLGAGAAAGGGEVVPGFVGVLGGGLLEAVCEVEPQPASARATLIAITIAANRDIISAPFGVAFVRCDALSRCRSGQGAK